MVLDKLLELRVTVEGYGVTITGKLPVPAQEAKTNCAGLVTDAGRGAADACGEERSLGHRIADSDRVVIGRCLRISYMWMLLLPAVTADPATTPMAMLLFPEPLFGSAWKPIAMLLLPL